MAGFDEGERFIVLGNVIAKLGVRETEGAVGRYGLCGHKLKWRQTV